MSDIKLIVLDLDGTLLNSNKEITEKTYRALEAAAAQGVQIVPCTGRYYEAMPACVKDLPFVNYSININGADIYDVRNQKTLASELMPLSTVLELIDYFRTLPGAYDAYVGNWGYIEQRYYDTIGDYVPNVFYIQSVHDYRVPVEDIRIFLQEKGMDVQKTQFYSQDPELIMTVFHHVKEHYPDCIPTTSGLNDAEVNSLRANKGTALETLAGILGIDMQDTMSFGDGGNDVPMIRAAGLGVAMGNAKPMVLEAADYVTLNNDEDGIALALEKFVLK